MNQEIRKRTAFLVVGMVAGIGLTLFFLKPAEEKAPVELPAPVAIPLAVEPENPPPRVSTRNRLQQVVRRAAPSPEPVETNTISPVSQVDAGASSPVLVSNPEERAVQPVILASPGHSYRVGNSFSVRVFLRGTPPPQKEITAAKADAQCGPLIHGPLFTRVFQLSDRNELADVVVYVKEGLHGKPFEAPATAVELDQSGCEYLPYTLALQAKQKLVIKNSDPVMHNVWATPKVSGNKTFNEAQMGKGPTKNKTFEKPELFIPFQCSVHPWMFAYVSVFDHPYFGVSDTNGLAMLPNLPAGDYKVGVKHRKIGEAIYRIIVDPQIKAPAELSVTLDLTDQSQ